MHFLVCPTMAPIDQTPDALLRRLIADSREWDGAPLSEVDASCFVMMLPDLCSELLAARTELRAAGRAMQESVTDAVLQRLGRHTPERDRGELMLADQMMLCTRLEAICVELLEARTLMRRCAA